MQSRISFILIPFICVIVGCLKKDKQGKEKFDDVVGVEKETYSTQATPAGSSLTIATYYFPAKIVEYHDDILMIKAKTKDNYIRLIIDVPGQKLNPDSVNSDVNVIAQKWDDGSRSGWTYIVEPVSWARLTTRNN